MVILETVRGYEMAKSKAKTAPGRPASGRKPQAAPINYRPTQAVRDALRAYMAATLPANKRKEAPLVDDVVRQFLVEKGYPPADGPQPAPAGPAT